MQRWAVLRQSIQRRAIPAVESTYLVAIPTRPLHPFQFVHLVRLVVPLVPCFGGYVAPELWQVGMAPLLLLGLELFWWLPLPPLGLGKNRTTIQRSFFLLLLDLLLEHQDMALVRQPWYGIEPRGRDRLGAKFADTDVRAHTQKSRALAFDYLHGVFRSSLKL